MTAVQYDPLPPKPRRPGSPAATLRRWRPTRRTLRWTWPLLLALLLGAVGGVAVAAAIHMPKVDSLASFTPSLGTQLYDKNGHAFRTFARERRVMLRAEEIPRLVQNAVLASEDSNFFRHGGIDAIGILRSALTDVRQGKIVQGASTITMQLARTIFLNRDKTWHRKIEEALTAVELEKTYSKQQILTLYLNLVNLGHGNYGIEAASRFYFNKSAKDLTLAEAATLVGIIPAPSRYSPYNTPEIVLRQRDRVLRRMLDEGFIKRSEYQVATAQPVLVASQQPQDNFAPYFAEDVRKHLELTYGATSLYEGGLQVQTTLDPVIQEAAQKAVQSWLLKVDHRRGWHGPIATLHETSGTALDQQVLPTWSGKTVPGRWYQGIVLEVDRTAARVKIGKEVFSLVREGFAWTNKPSPAELLKTGDVAWFRLGPPEPKSEKEAKKDKAKAGAAAGKAAPLVLYLEQEPRMEAAAVVVESKTGAIRAMVGGWDFERNKFNRITQARRQVGSAFKPFVYGAAIEQGWTPADTLLDAPTAFLGGDGKLSYRPENYYHKHYGIVTLRRALEQSINVPAVKLFELVGGKRVIDFAHRCGVATPMPAYPSMALGAADLLPIEMAGAYAAIANQGTYVQPYLVGRIVSPDGQVLEQQFPATRTATSPPVAYVLTHMMEGVVQHGTGYELHTLDLDVAGKTGTTDDFSDAWFIGFTPRYTILTWIGYDLKKSLGQGMSGAVAALPMWKAIAEDGLAKGWLTKGEKFAVPPGVVMKDIEYFTGLLPGQGTDRTLKEAFVAGTEPNRQYDNRWQTITSLPWYQQRAFYIPKEGESMAPAAPGSPAGTVPGEKPGREGQVVGEGDEGTVVPPPVP
ncbi:MAG TPA: PBP1A family penicillin-binding protein [Thermoanaerobaculia bacterium]|nr:PBP1A family penicillin-binding protein [Thermoanaerobaculia bacterium]